MSLQSSTNEENLKTMKTEKTCGENLPARVKEEIAALEDENGNTEGFYDLNQWQIKSEEIHIKPEETNTIQKASQKQNRKSKITKKKLINVQKPTQKTKTLKNDKLLKESDVKTVSKNAKRSIKKLSKEKNQLKPQIPAKKFISSDNKQKKSRRKQSNGDDKSNSVHDNGCLGVVTKINHETVAKIIKGKATDKVNLVKSSPKKKVISRKKRKPETKCDKCSYVTTYPRLFKSHLIVHLSVDEQKTLEVFKCQTCNYSTREKGNLSRHKKKHQDKKEVTIFSCKKCKFQTKYKDNLVRHLDVHKPQLKKKRFSCKLCHFHTSHLERLYSHMITHKTKTQTLKDCKHCSFQTFHSGHLKRHYKQDHTEISEILFDVKCEYCPFTAVSDHNLKVHVDKYHKNKVFECKYCPYQTVYKHNLTSHHLNHSLTEKTPKLVILKCRYCTFKTPAKLTMMSHLFGHKKKSVKLLTCELCSYQTLHGAGLQKHYSNMHMGWIAAQNKELKIKIIPLEFQSKGFKA